jgi:hypothetical protein
MFGLFKRKSRDRVTFEEQLRVLGRAGSRCRRASRPKLCSSRTVARSFEKEPYWLLLCTLGGEAELPEQAGPSGYPSDDMWHLDTECIEDDGAYAAIARRLAAISHGALPLEDVEDHVDVGGGRGLALVQASTTSSCAGRRRSMTIGSIPRSCPSSRSCSRRARGAPVHVHRPEGAGLPDRVLDAGAAQGARGRRRA